MKIVIFGASGKTGTLLTDQALTKGHQVTVYVRRPGSVVQQHPNLKFVTGKLNDTAKLKEAISGADACFSTLGGGSLTKHAPEIISGIKTICTIMETEGVHRFIYLSSIGVGESKYYMAPFIRFLITDLILRVPFADHNINEQTIIQSKLKWTIARPCSLTDGPLTSDIHHGSGETMLKGNPKISRANVASFMLEQLADERYVRQGVWLYE